MTNNYNLIDVILDHSKSKNWNNAVLEWNIVGFAEDRNHSSKCICGKENIKYLYDIKNEYNSNILTPIGSQCIKKFDVKSLKDKINVYESLFKLLSHYEKNKYIHFKKHKNLFNRKLIDYLGEKGVLEKEVYKGRLIDYHDALKTLYNARNLTENQTNFATAIIINKIIPYLKTELIIKDNKKL